MVIGCGISQVPTLCAIKDLGYVSLGIDGSDKACGIKDADIFEQCDIKDLNKILKIAKKYKINGIVVPGTDFPETAAYVSEKMRLPGIPLSVAQLCTNKYEQKKFLKDKGFLVPEITYMDKYNYTWGISSEMKFPLVIKPIDNMAARGTIKVNNRSELQNAYSKALQFSRSKKIVAEAFEEGMELSVDSLVWGDSVLVFAVADRHFALNPFFIEVGHTNPSILDEDTQREVRKVFIKAVKELGITHGSAKGDLKITDRGVMILEIAARISGGFLSAQTVPFATGYKPHEDLVRITLGEEPLWNYTLEPKMFSAERVFLSIPGRVEYIHSVHINPYRHMHVKKGDLVYFPSNNAQRCGSVISRSFSRSKAIEDAKNEIKLSLIRLEPRNNITENFLNDDDEYYNFKMFETIKKENDWHDCDMEEALSRVTKYTDYSIKDLFNDKKFWKYFYKGGVQGGVYYIDSYK